MLTRVYIDNFLCLVNFELELDETNVLLGPNGCGKTSVLRALSVLQQLIARSARIDEVMSTDDLTRWQSRNEQRFEINLTIQDNIYHYTLVAEHDRDRRRMRIIKELLTHNDHPIFDSKDSNAQLYHDDYTEGPMYRFDWSRSGVGVLDARRDNEKLTEFKRAIARFIIVSPCPPLFQGEARNEDDVLDLHMKNFVSWYRHASQENMGGILTLFEDLRDAMPGFDSINLIESGENTRTMKARFHGGDEDRKTIPFRLNEISDGQRLLVALYSLIHLSPSQALLFLDEPDNYLALREVQPFLAKIDEQCGDTLAQAVILSHHPVTIDYMAGASGRWFYRDGGISPVRVRSEPEQEVIDGLSLSEMVGRGWER
ncbi:MAG: AAA family ATPase [Cyanobacteria bacterium MAG CAR3_bin_5]|nr:AAA family ATPase [Cyanobacteria bacterium MAG CAR3_bin_5]